MKKYNYYGWFCLLITVLTTALYIQQLDIMRLTYLSSSVIDNYDITAGAFSNIFYGMRKLDNNLPVYNSY